MELIDEIGLLLQQLAEFAEKVRRRVGWFLLFGLAASLVFVGQFYAAESPVWWNLLKCSAILLPVFVWVIVWQLLSQLSAAPQLATTLVGNKTSTLTSVKAQLTEKKLGLLALLGIVRELRDNDAFETVTETIGSFTMLVNPWFLGLAVIMLLWLFGLIVFAPIILFL